MCDNAVDGFLPALEFALDWFDTTFFNNVSLDDDNFDNGDPETTIHVGLRAQCNGCKQRKAWKKELSKELILVAWHLTRWWD